MKFSLVEKQGIPNDVMADFYERGKNKDDFGTTQYRADSNQYDTLAIVAGQEVAGTADLLYPDGESSLAGCYILPDYREKLEMNGKSAFEHAAAARLDRTDRPARTSATTEHGKTQHIYSKFDFLPYEFELPRSPWGSSHINIAEPHGKRRFDRELYAPENVRDFVNSVAERFDQKPEFREGEYDGAEVNYMENVFDEGYEFFRIKEGNQELESVVGKINEKKKEAVNVAVETDPEIPSTDQVIAELSSEEFLPTAYKPAIEGSQMSQSSRFCIGYSSEPIRAELIPENRKFLEDAGWELELLKEGNKSSEFEIIQ